MSSASSEASAAQLTSGYSADMWLNIKLPAMMKLWQGVGGHSNFFVSEEDSREAMGSYQGSDAYKFAATLWRFAQVQPNIKHGFRQGLQEFVVDLDTPGAIGICLANPSLGTGTVLQYYIPNWERTLFATGRTFDFSEKG